MLSFPRGICLMKCPKCEIDCHRHGLKGGRQRYRCPGCKKSQMGPVDDVGFVSPLMPSQLLMDMRAVWKAGESGEHVQPSRRSLHQMMVSKPGEFFKQLRDMESEHKKLNWEHVDRVVRERKALAAERAEKMGESVVPVEAALAVEDEDVKAEELFRKLMAEWKAVSAGK